MALRSLLVALSLVATASTVAGSVHAQRAPAAGAASAQNIMIVRYKNGRRSSCMFNYKEIGRNLGQNIELKPGDTVVVP